MAARPPIISVPKSLYKHFAVLTVAITACVAMFADGDQRENIARQVAEHQAAKAQEMQKPKPKKGPMVAGLQDNRGYYINGNPDVGAVSGPPPELGALPEEDLREFGEFELTTKKSRRQLLQTVKPKLPPVLPPGMSPIPGLVETDAAATVS